MPSLGSLTAYVPTPRDANGRLITKTFERLVDDAIVAGATSIGVLGSTGGFAYMPRVMRKRVIKSAVSVSDGRVPIIAGIGDFTLAEIAVNLDEAQAAGVSGALLPPVAYQKLRSDEVFGLYRDVAAIAEVGVWLYNNPSTTRYHFGVDELVKIGRLRGIQGFKDRAASASEAKDRRRRVIEALPPRTGKRLEYGFSGDGIGVQALIDGASTWHSSIAGVLPEIVAAAAYAAVTGKRAEARLLQRQLTAISILGTQYGGIRVAHAVGEITGLEMGPLPRPLLPLPREERSLLRLTIDRLDVPSDLALATKQAAAGVGGGADVLVKGAVEPETGTEIQDSDTERVRRPSRHSSRSAAADAGPA